MYECLLCENKVYAVLSETVACRNLRVFWVKNYFDIFPCKVCAKLHVCLYIYPDLDKKILD